MADDISKPQGFGRTPAQKRRIQKPQSSHNKPVLMVAIAIIAVIIIAGAVYFLSAQGAGSASSTTLIVQPTTVSYGATSSLTTIAANSTSKQTTTISAFPAIGYANSSSGGGNLSGVNLELPKGFDYYICNGELVNLGVGPNTVSWSVDGSNVKASIGHQTGNWCNMTISGGRDTALVSGIGVSSPSAPSIFVTGSRPGNTLTLTYNVTAPGSFTVVAIANGGNTGNIAGVVIPTGCSPKIVRYGSPPPAPILSYVAVCDSQAVGSYKIIAYNSSILTTIPHAIISAYVFAPSGAVS